VNRKQNRKDTRELLQTGELRRVSLHAKKKLRERGVPVWWDKDLDAWLTETKLETAANAEWSNDETV
jgi:hypothetical protein